MTFYGTRRLLINERRYVPINIQKYFTWEANCPSKEHCNNVNPYYWTEVYPWDLNTAVWGFLAAGVEFD